MMPHRERAIWIVRHASRHDFEDPSWAANAVRPFDPPLSHSGSLEARAVANRLSTEPVSSVFSSPFLRCVQTAHPIAEARGSPLLIETGLSEWLNSDWFPKAPELLSLDVLVKRFPSIDGSYECRGTARYGESGKDALQRSGATASRLAEDYPGDLVIVGHGASVLGAIAGLLGAPWEQHVVDDPPNASIAKLVCSGQRWHIAIYPDTGHLGYRTGPP